MTDRIPTLAKCRPEVLAFARLMEAQLRKNEHKGGWKNCAPEWLLMRLREEADEVERELKPPGEKCGCREAMCPHVVPWFGPDPKRVGAEMADVGNFAMMLADVTGALAQVPPERPLTLEMVEETAETIVTEIMESPYWSSSEAECVEHAYRLLMLRLRQQMGGGQGGMLPPQG